jgi:hypothetical protein
MTRQEAREPPEAGAVHPLDPDPLPRGEQVGDEGEHDDGEQGVAATSTLTRTDKPTNLP